ncbi:MAG: hypothetical protein AABY53_01390 [Bdellovibrionota bacterium]
MYKILFLLLYNFSFADTQYSFNVYLYAQKNQLLNSSVNPLNQIFKTPDSEYHLDLRSEIKWAEAGQRVVIRPRIRTASKNIHLNNQTEQETKTKLDLTDAFYEQSWTPHISTTIGLQVYQWGPAEFINATNPFYHFNTEQRSVIYKEKGQILLRTNYSIDKENNLVLIFQPLSNNEAEWIAEGKFTPKILMKYEKSIAESANYFGFVAGSEEKSNVFVGEYFNYNNSNGFSAYADIKHMQHKINFIPQANGVNYNLVPDNQSKFQWPSLGVLGVRFEDNYDLRFEYIYNGAGFRQNDLNNAIAASSNTLNPNYTQNLQRFLKPGLELLGQNYFYTSLRVNEPFNLNEFNFYSRYMRSLQDESSQFQFEFDKALYDSYQVFSNISIASGTQNSEFRLGNDWQILIGIKLSL